MEDYETTGQHLYYSPGRSWEDGKYTWTYPISEGKDIRPQRESENSTEAKKDAGKPKISLVPPAIIEAIAKVREYGTEKYGDPQNWKKVSRERYLDAFLRHSLAEMKEPGGIDEESGMPHCWHAACNLAFIIQIDSAKSEAYRNFLTK